MTLNANPLKVREYLAAGLPVVSTKIPEVEVLGLAHIAATNEDFRPRDPDGAGRSRAAQAQRSDAMKKESWAGRVEEIRGHVAALGRRRDAGR